MRRRNRKIKINLSYILIIILLIFFLILFKFLTFKKIIIETRTDNNPNKQLLFSDLRNNINTNKIGYFFNKKSLSNKIFSLYPEIIKTQFKPNYITATLKINIETEKFVAQICDNECFYLGEHGYIFKKTQNYNDGSKFFKITSNLKLYENSKLDKQLVLAFGKIFELSNLKNAPLKTAEIFTNKDVKITMRDGLYILIDPNKNMDKQIKKLNFFLDNKKDSLTNLQYIDLRISQKIYYK